MIPPKLSLRGVTKAFGTKKVLQGIDVDVAPAESLVVIGGSGSGKSVLLKCVLGLLTPDTGKIEVDGEETAGISDGARAKVMRKFGMLFQGGALFDSLRVWENVAFGPIQSDGMAPGEAREVAIAKLGAVGLAPEIGDLFPSELSGGMQKRVALARAIAREPEIIFFDEPTTGLDPIMSDVINDLIVKCVSDLGATAVSITHDMASARKIGHRIAMIYDGRLIWQGPVAEIDRSGNPHVEQFIHGRAEGPIRMQVRKL
jgi:phospholipid/cholesterol/gamma-HCH transport system ATP-binding protein